MKEVILEFSTKEKAIEYAKKTILIYDVVEPKKMILLSNLTLIIF